MYHKILACGNNGIEEALPLKVRSPETWIQFNTDLSLSHMPILVEHILRNKITKIVNMGSGNGSVSRELEAWFSSDHSLNITDLDFAPISKALAYKCFIRGDLHDLPFPDRSIGAFFSFYTLDYVADPKKVVSEWHRVLAANGSAVLILHSPRSRFVSQAFDRDLIGDWKILQEYRAALEDHPDHGSLLLFSKDLSRATWYYIEPSIAGIQAAISDQESRVNISYYLRMHGRSGLFQNSTEIGAFFKDNGFEQIEINIVSGSDILAPKYFNTAIHDGWLVTLKP